jgi:hypothetical protein
MKANDFAARLVFALALAGAGAAHASEASTGHAYRVQMKLGIHGQDSAPLLTIEEGQPFAVAGDAAGKPWRAEFVLKRTGQPGAVRVAGKITEGDATLAKPVLIGRLGERMGIKVGDDVQVSLEVSERAP